MKTIIAVVALALSMSGQSVSNGGSAVPVEPTETKRAESTVKTDRPLTESEILKIRLSIQKVSNINNAYKISEYNKEIQPIVDEERQIFNAACKSVGVPEDKIQTECEFSTGYGPDDKPLPGVSAHVKWVKPTKISK